MTCIKSDCCPQEDISNQERARYLYENHNEDVPNGLICYDCAAFHSRKKSWKNKLSAYPVCCPLVVHCPSRRSFIRQRTKSQRILICGISVPWLQIHQTARALRHGPQYGFVVMNDFRKQRRFLFLPNSGQTDSKALLTDDRLLVRTRQYLPIHHRRSHRKPSWLEDRNAEFICPHAKETFLYSRHLANEMIEACRLLSNDYDNRQLGFVHKRYRCNQCPTEYVIEIVLNDHFDAAHVYGQSFLRRLELDYMLLVSRYMDFGHCHSPCEMEWKALSTWPEERPKGDWGPTVQRVDNRRPALDLTDMDYISTRFERRLRMSEEIRLPD